MKYLLLILLLASCNLVRAQFGTPRDLAFWGKRPSQLGTCGWDGNYLVQQTFETPTTGYDNGETWTESGAATITPNYSGVVLQGTQSLRIVEVGSGAVAQTQTSFAAQDEIWVYFMLRFPNLTDHNPAYIGWIGTPGSVVAINVNLNFTVSICGSACATTVATMTSNTTYHVWAHYKKGSGTDQVQDIAFSTTGIKPLAGNNFAQTINGDRTAQISKLTLAWDGEGAAFPTREIIFDKIRVANTCIGDNPP